MQPTQISGMADRAAAVFATMFLGWLVKQGVMGESDAAVLAPSIVLLPSLAWGWWNNRAKAQLQKAASVVGANGEKTVVIAPPELAFSTPEKNIISTAAPPEVIKAAVIEAKTS